jgi:hypothetical protein
MMRRTSIICPAPQAADKTQLGNLVQGGIDLIDQFHLVAARRQKNPDQLHHLIPGKDQARVAAAGVELGQLFAQQRQQQADRIGELPPGNQARDGR